MRLLKKTRCNHRAIIWVFLSLVAGVFLFVSSLREVYEGDTFRHIKTGEWIIQNHGTPRTDPFSEANTGKRWIDQDFLSQVAFHIVHRIWGAEGLSFYSSILILIAFGLAALAGADPRSPLILAGMLLIGIIAASERFQVRPEIHSLAMVGLFLLVLERYRRGSSDRLIWILPPMQVLWENLHGGTLLGTALTGAYLAGEGFARLGNRLLGWPAEVMESRRYRNLVVAFCLVVLAFMLNPWGPLTILMPLKIQAHEYSMSMISEWQSPLSLFRGFQPLPIRIYPWIIGVTALSFILNYRRLNLSQVFACLGLMTLSLMSRRHLALFALAAVPFAAQNLAMFRQSITTPYLEEKAVEHPLLSRSRTIFWFAGASFLVLTYMWLSWQVATDRYYINNRYFFRFGYGLSTAFFPWGVFDFLDKTAPEGPAFNNHDLGSYFIWREFPRYRVFLDNRTAIYDAEYLREYETAVKSPKGFSALASRHRPNFAAILHTAGDGPDLTRILYLDPEWVPVYFDQATILFLNDSPSNRPLIEKHGFDLAAGDGPVFSVSNPGAFDYAAVADVFQAVRLLERADEFYSRASEMMPGHALLRYNVAKTRLMLGKYSESIEIAKKAVELDPRLAEAHMVAANAYYYLGDFARSIDECDRAINISPENPDAHSNRAIALLGLGRRKDAVESFQKALEIDPDNKNALLNFASTLESTGDSRALSAWRDYLSLLKRAGAPPEEVLEAEQRVMRLEK